MLRIVLLSVAVIAGASRVSADVVQLTPAKDNTLYQSNSGSLSNGAGDSLFIGRTGQLDSVSRRRALLAFDIAGNIPPGSTIESVSMTLFVLRARNSGLLFHRLHRVLADWGEGASNNSGGGGLGVPAQTNDATWIHRFFANVMWQFPGGDFALTESGTATIGGFGSYTWQPTVGMIQDIQSWLDNPSTNFGWIVIGSENQLRTARKIASRENSAVSRRPVLTIEFTPLPSFACCLTGGLCESLLELDCAAAGGTSSASGISCEGDGDGDGVDQLCGDLCPFDAAKTQPGECGCGIPEPGVCGCGISDVDTDGDSVPDCFDDCPNDSNKVAPGQCGCGVDDDADSDGDTIPDCTDKCAGIDDRIFAPECADAIPTVSEWGLIVLALALLALAKVRFSVLRRRVAD